MRALVMREFGDIGTASFADMPVPVAGPDDLVVRMAGAGVNPTDYKEMQGCLTGFYPPYVGAWIPGHDGAGIVEQVGSSVTEFAVGDRVVFLSDRAPARQSGTFAEFALVNRRMASLAPSSISLVEASTIPVAAATSYQGLFRADIGAAASGQTVLVHGAAGGLGSFAVSLCAGAGLGVAATCRTANRAYVRELGAEVAIDYTRSDVASSARNWSGAGVDLVLDCVSGGSDLSLLDAVKSGGRLVIVLTADHDGDIELLRAEAAKREISVPFFVLDLEHVAANLAELCRLVDEGALRMPEIRTFPFADSRQALETMAAGGVRGKLAIEIASLG